MEEEVELSVGDVIMIQEDGWGFLAEDFGKYVEVIGKQFSGCAYEYDTTVYDQELETKPDSVSDGEGVWHCNIESFIGADRDIAPMVLLNTKENNLFSYGVVDETSVDKWTDSHYNNYYQLTPQDIEAGKIKVDAYWVAKQWKTGSRDDSGALWHSLKTIARFGDKNDVEREVKALYNQAKALGRIYGVDLE